MPSFQDSAVILFLALLLFGPKKLPELARYIGKIMGEFRRASNEFRMQMEDELRIAEQAEQQKKISAMEAAAPVAPPLNIPEPEHPHTRVELAAEDVTAADVPAADAPAEHASESAERPEPLPIATSGSLEMMPPATGLPVARSSSLSPVFDSIPHTADPENHAHEPAREAVEAPHA